MDRRGFKLIPIAGFIVVCLGLAWFFESQATTTLIFVRHTDTATALFEASDPPLSASGFERAELLADVLQDIDVIAGVDAIYASPSRRTQQTAANLAERLDLEVQLADPYDVEPFMARVLREHKGEIVLVVTHGDILAPLVEELQEVRTFHLFRTTNTVISISLPFRGSVKSRLYGCVTIYCFHRARARIRAVG